MRIFICDENVIFREKMAAVCEKYLKESKFLGEVLVFDSAEEYLDSKKIGDVLILDIEMKGIGGIELKRILEEKNDNIKIIYLTNNFEYIQYAFGINVCGFLEKKVEENILYNELDKIENNINKIDLLETGFIEKPFVPIEEIIYIKSEENYLMIKTKKENHLCKGRIKDLQNKLYNYGFGRANQSYMVNFSNIEYADNFLITNTQEKIVISRRSEKEFRECYKEYLRKHLGSS